MKCENCGVVVSSEFSHAIKNNQCPACGKGIMQQAKLASFLSLRTLLKNNIPEKGVDSYRIASLIVANFEIKQLFKEELKKSDEGGIMDVSEDDEVEVVEEVMEDPDAEFKTNQKKEAKAVLQKMRDDALGGALKDRYGLADDGLLLTEEDAGMHEIVNKHKQETSLQNILMGGSPVHRRDA